MRPLVRPCRWLGFVLALAGSLLVLVQCHHGGRTVMTKNPSEAAKEAFRQGVERYEQGRYAEAETLFLSSYNDSPSYKILYNMGQAQVMQGKNAEAIRTFRRYLKEGGRDIPEERRQSVEEDIRNLGRTPAGQVASRPSGGGIRPITAMSSDDFTPSAAAEPASSKPDAGKSSDIRPPTSGH